MKEVPKQGAAIRLEVLECKVLVANMEHQVLRQACFLECPSSMPPTDL